MAQDLETKSHQPDPAAVFACAVSLREACQRHADSKPGLNLGECYKGMDEFMRQLMRVAHQFEVWSCAHVAFEHLQDVWPYLLEDRFGEACLAVIRASALAEFNDDDRLWEKPAVPDG